MHQRFPPWLFALYSSAALPVLAWVLSTQGVSVQRECRGVNDDVQAAFRTLKGNAVANANKKRADAAAKDRFAAQRDRVERGAVKRVPHRHGLVPPGGDAARTEKLIDEEIARLATQGPSATELTKARNQALAGFWRGLQTISGKAEGERPHLPVLERRG